MQPAEALVPISLFAGGFAMVFGIVYLKTRQNLAMIEKGMNPKESANRPTPFKNLKWALLLIGSGIGLFLAYMLDNFIINKAGMVHDDNPAVYFSLIAIGGGLGLFGCYKMEKKSWSRDGFKDGNI